jgi:hypothetical protein
MRLIWTAATGGIPRRSTPLLWFRR